MINDTAFLETLIKRRIPDVTVFQNPTTDAAAEIDIQNVPGRPLHVIRLLLTAENAAAIHSDPALAERVIATLNRALTGPSDESKALLDLRAHI